MLVRTKANYDYSTMDDRALTHEGCIVDVGCAGWDMFASLVGQKRIIGVDPFEEAKEGYEFWKGIIGAYDGYCLITVDNDESNVMLQNYVNARVKYEMKCWKTFCDVYNIDKVSILKLNIEGAEYPLLNSIDSDDFDKIDQIMVSFHDWINPKWRHLTFAAIQLLLVNGYERKYIASQYGWNLFVKQ